jgi:hypothetical protein
VSWYLNEALTTIRAEVDRAFPNRDRGSDGTIGDPAHAARSSDHNPDPAGEPDAGSVDALDLDVELNGPGKPYALDIERVKRAFEAHPSSSYWIHDDRIAFRSEGWRPRSYAYAGPSRNQHRRHVHLNTRDSHERSTVPIHITGESMDRAEFIGHYRAAIMDAAVQAVDKARPWQYKGGGVPEGFSTLRVLNDTYVRVSQLSIEVRGLQATAVAQAAAVERLAELVAAGNGDLDVAAIVGAVRSHIDAKIAELPGPDVIADAVVSEIAS